MDKIKKLFKRLAPSEKKDILLVLSSLASGSLGGLDVKKIVGTDYWRIRAGRCRVIFKKESGENVVYEIRLRNENTYKNLH